MTQMVRICPKVEKNTLEYHVNSIVEPALYEYAFPTEEIRFEVVKVVSTIFNIDK